MSRKKKGSGIGEQASVEGAVVATAEGDDLRARVARANKAIHAMARGVTGLEVAVYPPGLPGLRIVTAAQLYVVQVNANWGAKAWAKKRANWIPLVEAKDALMHRALESMPDLIKAWKSALARYEDTDCVKAEARMDEIEELLRV